MQVGDLVAIHNHWKLDGTIGVVTKIHGATARVRIRATILMPNGKKDWFYCHSELKVINESR